MSTSPRPLPVAATEAAVLPASAEAADELRTSNTVAGFQYSRLKGMLYVTRIILSLPFLPLWPFFIAHEAKDWSIARNYFGTIGYCLRTILIHIRFGSFVRLLKYTFVLGPKGIEQRIATRRGACTRCAKCCKQYDCIFLGQDAESREYYCKVYQTSYWYYGTCGRYPVDQQDIDDHACPGFSFENSPA